MNLQTDLYNQLAHDIETNGFAAHANQTCDYVQALAISFSPNSSRVATLVEIVLDETAPDVARQRAFGHLPPPQEKVANPRPSSALANPFPSIQTEECLV